MTEGNVTGQPSTVANPSDAFMEAKMDGERDGSIQVSGSKGVDFDALDSIEATRQEYVESKNDKLAKNKIPGATNEKGNGKGSKESGEETSEESSEEASKEGVVENKSQKAAEQKARKIIKALDGDSYLDIPHDANVPVKIDGKVIHVPVADLISNFSGKTSWDRKFSEVDKKEKIFKKEKEQIFSHFKTMKEHMDSNNPMEAFSYLVDTLGGDKHTFRKAMRDSFTPEILSLYNMTEEERHAHEVKSESEMLRDRLSRTEAERNRYAQEKALFSKVQDTKRQLGISDEQWDLASESLSELGHENTEPEFVRDYILAKNAVSRVDSVMNQIAPGVELPTEQSDKIVRFVMEDPGVTDEDLDYIIRQATAIDSRKMQTLNDKAAIQPKKPVYNANSTPEKPEFFTDYED